MLKGYRLGRNVRTWARCIWSGAIMDLVSVDADLVRNIGFGHSGTSNRNYGSGLRGSDGCTEYIQISLSNKTRTQGYMN